MAEGAVDEMKFKKGILKSLHPAKDEIQIYFTDGKFVYGLSQESDTDLIVRKLQGADLATFKILRTFYAKDIHRVYFANAFGARVVTEDTSHFRMLDKYGSYSKDSRFVYYSGMKTDMNVSSFRIINDAFVRDRKSVRAFNTVLEDVVPRKFRRLGKECGYERDTIYCYTTKFIGMDKSSFQFFDINGGIAKDKRIVMCENDIVPDVDAASLKKLNTTYYLDKNTAYYVINGNCLFVPLPNSDPKTFQVLGVGKDWHSYAKDNNHVYRDDEVLTGVHPKEFVLP